MSYFCVIFEWRTKLRQKCEKWESLGVNNVKIRGKSIKKSPQQSCLPPISQIPTDFLPLKVTQIAQMTQISFTFLPLKFPRRWSHPQNMTRERSELSPGAMKPEASCPQAQWSQKQAVPRRSHPAKYGEGFDAPPTLERSGSEHRRAVTSFPSEKGRLG